MAAHSNNTRTFQELTYAEQASSISAQILSLEKAMIAHERRAGQENRNVAELHAQLIAQVQRMLGRFENQERRQ